MPEKEPIEIPPRGTRGTKMPFEGALMKIAKPCADTSSLVHQPGQEPGQNLAGGRQPKAQGRREVAERQGAGGRSRADRGCRASLRRVSEKDRSRDPDHQVDARQRLSRATSVYPYQPTTSTMTWVDPNALKMSTCPDADSCTTTRLGTVCPATKLRSDARGWLAPSGQTIRSLAAVGLVTVTFRTTALGGIADAAMGTPPLPATCTTRLFPAPSGAWGAPVPLRVSTMRAGTRATNCAPAAELS